jgi:hypothetical protein
MTRMDTEGKDMTRFPRWLVAVAISAVVLVGCSSGSPAQQIPSTEASFSPEGSASAVGLTTLVAGSEALPAGTYRLDLEALTEEDGHYPPLTITVPDGWGNLDGWAILKRHMAIGFWDVDLVFEHPCSGTAVIQPGPTIADLARALGEQPMRDATEPVDIVVDGFKGLQMELSVPAHFDFSKCNDGYFDSWFSSVGSWNSRRFHQGPGQVDRLWILDIDGERLVVGASFMPSTDAKDRQELWMVMESIRFET